MVVSHPIQYLSPWWVRLARVPGIDIKVFYLWDFGVALRQDHDFGMAFRWDIPLLDGYEFEFIENVSADPGTHHFSGLDNPALVPRLLDWRPDAILLSGYAYRTHVRLLLSRKLACVPIVLRGDSHNLGRPSSLKAIMLRQIRKRLFRHASAFLSVGIANTKYFEECAAASQRIFLAPHFVDNARFGCASPQLTAEARAWRRQLGIRDDAFVFGFVGKFEAKKRPLDLLRASAGLNELQQSAKARQVVTLFVGSGEEQGALQETAGVRVGHDVFFAPFQNQSEMPRVYSAIDALVLPSGYGETWGLCVNEAMNLGVPAIVSDVVGCGPDLIIPGVTGWISRTGDIEDLRRTLLTALGRTDEQRAAMSQATRRHVEKFSVERATAGLLEALSWVCRHGQRQRAS